MKTRLVLLFCLLLSNVAYAEKRFNRPVVSLANSKSYQYFKLDDNTFPFLKRTVSPSVV